MDAGRWRKVRAVLDTLLETPLDERAARLEKECAGDETLQREVQDFLAAYDEAGTFLESTREGLPPLSARCVHPGAKIGAYRLEECIGRGGMGEVFSASRDDDVYRKRVAVKLARDPLSGDGEWERFRQERQILANLEHKNIAQLLDGG
ncbi:MAG: protein kinase, partial [Acidobacteriota bacterium]